MQSLLGREWLQYIQTFSPASANQLLFGMALVGRNSCQQAREMVKRRCAGCLVRQADSGLSKVKSLHLTLLHSYSLIALNNRNSITSITNAAILLPCSTLIMPSIPPLPFVSVPKPLNPRYHLSTCQSSLSPPLRPWRPQEQVAFPPLKVDCSRPAIVPPLLQSAKGPLTIEIAAYTMAQDVQVTTSLTEKLYVESQAVESGVDFPVGGIWRAGAGERDL
jgi:hypothetical protein